jgi:hypothetical protein
MLSEELGEFFQTREASLQSSKSSMNADLVPSLIAKLYLDLSGVDVIGLSLTKVRNCGRVFVKFTFYFFGRLTIKALVTLFSMIVAQIIVSRSKTTEKLLR